jgi:hypothetical protein
MTAARPACRFNGAARGARSDAEMGEQPALLAHDLVIRHGTDDPPVLSRWWRSATALAKGRFCSTSSTVSPSRLSVATISPIASMMTGARPSVGSSSSRKLDPI